jgi:hypothetical protein
MTRNRIFLSVFTAGIFLLCSVFQIILWGSNLQINQLIIKIALYYFLICSGLLLIALIKYKDKFSYLTGIICAVISFLAVLPISFTTSHVWKTSAILFENKYDKSLTIEYCSNFDYNDKQTPDYYYNAQKTVIMRKKINFCLESIEKINYNRYSYILKNEKDDWIPKDTIPTEYLYNLIPLGR